MTKEIFYYSVENFSEGDWIPFLKTGRVPNRYDADGKPREFTSLELDEILDAFRRNVVGSEIPIAKSHWGEEDAYGWAKDMKRVDNTLYVLVDWTELGKEAIAKNIFKYVSAEVLHNYEDENGNIYPRVVTRIVLTNSPAIKNMPPLQEVVKGIKLYGYSAILNDSVSKDGGIVEPSVEAVEEADPEPEGETQTALSAKTDKLKEKAKARSKKYGIPVRKDGHLTPPKKYVEAGAKSEKDYADPVNYRYPISNEKFAKAALNYFSKEKNRRFYPPKARLVIWERIIKACLKFGIKVSYDKKMHKKLPEKIKKKMEGYSMDNLDEFRKDVEKAVKEEFSEKLSKLDKKVEELSTLKEKLEEENKKLTEELSALKKEKEQKEWEEKLSALAEKGKITPAMVEKFKDVDPSLRDTLYDTLSDLNLVDLSKEGPSTIVPSKANDEKEKEIIEKYRKMKEAK